MAQPSNNLRKSALICVSINVHLAHFGADSFLFAEWLIGNFFLCLSFFLLIDESDF